MKKVILLVGAILAFQHVGMKAMKAPNNRIDITSEAAFNEVLRTNDNVVVLISTTWCGPCKKLKPIVEQVTREMPHVMFAHIDGDSKPLKKLVDAHASEGFPTLKLFKKGKQVQEVVGAQDKDALTRVINAKLGAPVKPSVQKVQVTKEVVVTQKPQAKTLTSKKPASKMKPAPTAKPKKYGAARYRPESEEAYSEETYSEEYEEGPYEEEGSYDEDDYDNGDDNGDDYDNGDDNDDDYSDDE